MDKALDDFHAGLVGLLPTLRNHAHALTRDRDEANDLIQDTITAALARRHQFQPGTNLAAWTSRILRNRFIDGYRRRRPAEELDPDNDQLWSPANQIDCIMKTEFLEAFGKLRPLHREALVLATVEGRSYDEIAERLGCAVGTVKSRVCRARDALMTAMLGHAPDENTTMSALLQSPAAVRPKNVRSVHVR